MCSLSLSVTDGCEKGGLQTPVIEKLKTITKDFGDLALWCGKINQK
jgi:hypothetical protein